ncbi:MAG: protein kinase [Gammaproteobacteria bacterium]|nr:protein kinase [Gammaproteobacteria bacterium]
MLQKNPVDPSITPVFSRTPVFDPSATPVFGIAGRKIMHISPARQWQTGDLLLGLYEVREILGAGGFGLVYRVFHRQWHKDLAVKSPRQEILATTGGMEDFEREAETWVKLGLHSHIVNCYYVRRIEGFPCVFVEYINGGSLEEAIARRTLYAGEARSVVAHLLDIAIQFAWGLHFAHEQGLIHQDVKPANVMLTNEGLVKITDFGLAHAIRVAADKNDKTEMNGEDTLIVQGVGMTPAYAAPEQIRRLPLTRRADLWGWAVSVLEMFVGRRDWNSGLEAASELDTLVKTADKDIPVMPAALHEVLRQCFREDPGARPHDLHLVAERLREIYQEVSGDRYPREEPPANRETADGLNNRAVSLFDLGHKKSAEKLWDHALKIDPHHLESAYNRGLLLWRDGRLLDVEFIENLEEVGAFYRGAWLDHYLLALAYLERGDGKSAAAALQAIPPDTNARDQIQAAYKASKENTHYGKAFGRHEAEITALMISRDGRHLLSGDAGGILKQWSGGYEGGCLHRCNTHGKTVSVLAMSEDSQIVVSGGGDSLIHYWDLQKEQEFSVPSGHQDGVTALELSADKRWLLSGNPDGAVKLWGAGRASALRTFTGHGNPVLAVALSRNRRYVAAMNRDGSLYLWGSQKGNCLKRMRLGKEPASTLLTAADGRIFVLAGDSVERGVYLFKLWDLSSGRCVRQFDARQDRIDYLRLSTDAGYALTADRQGLVRVWQMANGRCLCSLQLDKTISALALSPNSHYLYTGNSAGELSRHEIFVATRSCRAVLRLSQAGTSDHLLAYQQDYEKYLEKTRLALAHKQYNEAASHVRWARMQPGYARAKEIMDLWRNLYLKLPKEKLRGTWETASLKAHNQAINILNISDDNREFLSGSYDGTLKRWSLENRGRLQADSGEIIFGETILAAPVLAAAQVPGGKFLLASRDGSSTGENSAPALWNIKTGKRLRMYHNSKLKGQRAFALALDVERRFVLTGHENGMLCLWTMHSAACLRSFDGHTNRINAVILSPDAHQAISAGCDNTVKVWNIRDNCCTHTLEGHPGGANCLAISPDGNTLVSGGKDRILKLWDIRSGRCLSQLQGHRASVTSVAISGDGRFALSGSSDRTLKLWEISAARCLHTFKTHEEEVASVALSMDGDYALAGYARGTIKCWFLDWELNAPSTDWAENIAPYIEVFYSRYIPYQATLPLITSLDRKTIDAALTPLDQPAVWSKKQLSALHETLARAGYGWLEIAQVDGQLRKFHKQRRQWRKKYRPVLNALGIMPVLNTIAILRNRYRSAKTANAANVAKASPQRQKSSLISRFSAFALYFWQGMSPIIMVIFLLSISVFLGRHGIKNNAWIFIISSVIWLPSAFIMLFKENSRYLLFHNIRVQAIVMIFSLCLWLLL